jgi:hypothetical protein
MDPAVVGGYTIRSVGDVAGVHTQTVVELALEELGERKEGQNQCSQGMGNTIRKRIHSSDYTDADCPVLQSSRLGSFSLSEKDHGLLHQGLWASRSASTGGMG